jgi:hypothetical protein
LSGQIRTAPAPRGGRQPLAQGVAPSAEPFRRVSPPGWAGDSKQCLQGQGGPGNIVVHAAAKIWFALDAEGVEEYSRGQSAFFARRPPVDFPRYRPAHPERVQQNFPMIDPSWSSPKKYIRASVSPSAACGRCCNIWLPLCRARFKTKARAVVLRPLLWS